MATTHPEPTSDVVPEWTVGDRIAKARRHAGLRAEDIAEILSVSRTTISNWENGVAPCRPVFVREIARQCGVSYEWLLGTPPPKATKAARSRCVSDLVPRMRPPELCAA